MAVSQLTAEERLARKRFAAKMRQKRCRARKRSAEMMSKRQQIREREEKQKHATSELSSPVRDYSKREEPSPRSPRSQRSQPSPRSPHIQHSPASMSTIARRCGELSARRTSSAHYETPKIVYTYHCKPVATPHFRPQSHPDTTETPLPTFGPHSPEWLPPTEQAAVDAMLSLRFTPLRSHRNLTREFHSNVTRDSYPRRYDSSGPSLSPWRKPAMGHAFTKYVRRPLKPYPIRSQSHRVDTVGREPGFYLYVHTR